MRSDGYAVSHHASCHVLRFVLASTPTVPIHPNQRDVLLCRCAGLTHFSAFDSIDAIEVNMPFL
jgi:hypothetical protein